MKQSQLPQSRKWVSDSFLAEYFAVNRTTIWRWVKEGRLPSPTKIGRNTTRFNYLDVVAMEAEL